MLKYNRAVPSLVIVAALSEIELKNTAHKNRKIFLINVVDLKVNNYFFVVKFICFVVF